MHTKIVATSWSAWNESKWAHRTRKPDRKINDTGFHWPMCLMVVSHCKWMHEYNRFSKIEHLLLIDCMEITDRGYAEWRCLCASVFAATKSYSLKWRAFLRFASPVFFLFSIIYSMANNICRTWNNFGWWWMVDGNGNDTLAIYPCHVSITSSKSIVLPSCSINATYGIFGTRAREHCVLFLRHYSFFSSPSVLRFSSTHRSKRYQQPTENRKSKEDTWVKWVRHQGHRIYVRFILNIHMSWWN